MSDHYRKVCEVVLEALDIPYAATHGDDEIRDKILDRRLAQAVSALTFILDDGPDRPDVDTTWHLSYLREKFAEHPPIGYRTWDEAVAETAARKVEGAL
ncbi:MAG: hypothetical protein JWR24_102 [Actinoallomurus sp.]|jgi:hypothetical protein|nr:hypothetical protein [Actinoallomurus sp.]